MSENVPPRPARESREARQQRIVEQLASLNVTPAEASLFNVTHLCLQGPKWLVGCAATEDYCIGTVSSLAQCEQALVDCLAKGWLQVVDEAALARMQAEVRAAGLLGPVYHYAHCGAVDFTASGAAMWQTIRETCFRRDRPPSVYSDVTYEKTRYFFRSPEHAVRGVQRLRSLLGDELSSVSEPIPSGAWRVEWWRRFAGGCTVDITERRQWQGRAGGGNETCVLARESLHADRSQLPGILWQHQCSPIQWLLLESVGDDWCCESAEQLCRSLVSIKGRRKRSWYSIDDFRAVLDHCLQLGWLRIIDEQELLVIRELDAADSAQPILANSQWPELGQVSFTHEGVALYRQIMADWLGDDWEDGLVVSRGLEWEAHYYCTTETPFFEQIAEHQSRGEIIRGIRCEPIGPWCVKWWERFPGGYRLELDLSRAEAQFVNDQRAVAAAGLHRQVAWGFRLC